MRPIVKKAVAAIAIKEGIERIAEARRPHKPSLAARLLKLTVIGGLLYGAFYAYKSGLLRSVMGSGGSKAPYEGYDGSVTVQRPVESSETGDPVGAPNA
jgi:hypothetical protein